MTAFHHTKDSNDKLDRRPSPETKTDQHKNKANKQNFTDPTTNFANRRTRPTQDSNKKKCMAHPPCTLPETQDGHSTPPRAFLPLHLSHQHVHKHIRMRASQPKKRRQHVTGRALVAPKKPVHNAKHILIPPLLSFLLLPPPSRRIQPLAHGPSLRTQTSDSRPNAPYPSLLTSQTKTKHKNKNFTAKHTTESTQEAHNPLPKQEQHITPQHPAHPVKNNSTAPTRKKGHTTAALRLPPTRTPPIHQIATDPQICSLRSRCNKTTSPSNTLIHVHIYCMFFLSRFNASPHRTFPWRERNALHKQHEDLPAPSRKTALHIVRVFSAVRHRPLPGLKTEGAPPVSCGQSRVASSHFGSSLFH